MQGKEDDKKTGSLDTAAKVADGVKKSVSINSAAAKGAGISVPGAVGNIGKVAGVIAGVIREPGDGWVEKAVCGTAKVLAQGYAAAPLAGAAITQGAAAMPLPHPYAKAAGGAIGLLAATPAINEVTKPVGELAGQMCHKSFDVFKKPNTPPTGSPDKQQQKTTAQTKLTESTARNNAVNGFQPNLPATIPLARYNAFNTPYRPFYHPPAFYYTPFNVRSEVQAILASNRNLSFTDRLMIERRVDMACSYMESQMRFGYSHTYGLGDFRSTLAMTGLMSSYNSYNIRSMVYEAVRSYGQIGGVAGDVSLITDLIDSDAHAEASSYFFCFPTQSFPFPLSLIKQIASELKKGYCENKTLPFFSLHFNNKGFMYPVNHTAYGDSLIGEIIALLDFWMKGFLNGGIFDAEFLKKWHELCNCDEQHLRAKLIDLKKYCKAHAERYISLRELESRYGLKSKPSAASSAYQQPFMTSFRIIANQDHIKRHGNILIPSPNFRVEYSIDLMPDYKEYLEKYHKEHGDYPEDYEHTRQCYELFANEIKEQLPKMPFCRDYFQLLGVINSFCYAYVTFEKMGKEPVISMDSPPEPHFIPKAFPPIPVRYFRTYPISTTCANVLTPLFKDPQGAQEFDAAAAAIFSNKQKRSFPEPLKQRLQNIVTQYIQGELTKTLQTQQVIEINEDEIERITKELTKLLISQIIQVHNTLNKIIQNQLSPISESEKKSTLNLPLPTKITAAETLVTQYYSKLKARWESSPTVELDEVLRHFPKTEHTSIKKNFAELDKGLELELKELCYLIKKAAGILLPSEQLNEQQIKISLEIKQSIENEFKGIDEQIEKLCAEQLQLAQKEIEELKSAKQHCQNQVASGPQIIADLQQQKAAKINACPPHCRSLPANVAIINQITVAYDQDIASVQQQIASFANNIVLIDKDINQIQESINAGPSKKLSLITKIKKGTAEEKIILFTENFVKAKAEAYKREAIHDLEQYQKGICQELAKFNQHVHHFSTVLAGTPALLKQVIAKEYTHTLLGFTGQELAQKTGDNFQIVGGCGMSLPNIRSRSIDNAEEFSEALAQTLSQNTTTQPAKFSFNNQNYIVFELPVIDTPQTINAPKSSTITELLDPNVDVIKLSTIVGTEQLDPSGASFVHYAATTLDGPAFTKIPIAQWTIPDALGNTPLHYAAQSGNTAVILEILKVYADQVNCKNNRGLTPLFLAVQNNCIDAVKPLIDHKADANFTLPNGLFPLFVALQNNFHDLAFWLIDNVPQLTLNQEIDSKMTALHLSIDAKDLIVATKLVEKNALCSIKRKSDGFTAVHSAAKQGLVELLKTMHAKGIPLHQALESGKTPLHLAAEANQVDALDFLLSVGADKEAKTVDGETPLMLAIKAGNLAVAQRLVTQAPIDTVNNQGQTAAQLAIQYGLPTIADTLIERGENPELIDKKGHNCIYYLVRNGEESRFSAWLAAKKFNPSYEFQGENALELAARYGQFLIVYELLAQGFSFRKKANRPSLLEYAIDADEIGFVKEHISESTQTKVDLACLAARHGSIRCLAWLLKQLDKKELQTPSLIKASLESYQIKAIELVLEKLADINQPLDSQQNTALHLAARYGSKNSVKLLLSRGALVQLRNTSNQTAFHIAIQQVDKSLLKDLFKLTQPKDWPLDLWGTPAFKPGHPLYDTLAKFKKKLPSHTLPQMAKQDKVNDLPAIILNNELIEGLAILKQMFIDDEFDAAADLLKEKPQLLSLFESEQGADLLQFLFANICDYSAVKKAVTQSDSKDGEDELDSLPHKLLDHLKKSGINPAKLTGSRNVLLSMLGAKNDIEACYRLKLFNQYFPESLTALALDKSNGSNNIVEIALKTNKKQLFFALDELCSSTSTPDNKALNSLYEAVLAHDYELVANLLKRYPVDSLNEKRQTPLMAAAALNNVRIMELLLIHGANADRVDIFGQNALHHALNKGSEEAALTILPILGHKNQANRSGATPLMSAAAKGLTSIVNFLCEQADYSESYDKKGFNALHHAALHGQSKTIEQLVAQGFNVNGVENLSNPEKSSKYLKRSALHLAALHGHSDAVNTLLSLGANPEQEDNKQNTVFEYAVMSKQTVLLQTLQQLEGYHQKKRDISLLLAAAQVDNVEVLSQLILNDINLNGSDASGMTALHITALNNSIQFARLLVAGKDIAIDVTDQNAMTPLHYAALTGHVGLIEVLVGAGAKINYHNNNHPTALFMACAQGRLGAVTSLVRLKADFSIPNSEGLTPAQIALLHGHIDIAQKLHSMGDTSLNTEAINALPKVTQDKLKDVYSLFQHTLKSAPSKVGDLLINHGIYRQKSVLQSVAIPTINPAV